MTRRSRALWIVLPVLWCALARPALAGSTFLDEAQQLRLDWGADAYYSFLGVNGSLISPQSGENVIDAQAEDGVYAYLLRNFFFPKMLQLELSINPLPVAGVYLKSQQRGFYERGKIIDQVNIIESVTSGFPEPGAVSLFIGNNVFMMNFDTGETEGIGFGGLLVSYGNYHIVSNELVRENWLETEAKLKGIALSNTQKLSFSFRVGARFHSHPDIRNSVYVSMARSHLDRQYWGWSPLRNSEAEFRADFSQHDGRPTRFIALFGKKLPSPEGEYIFSLALGVEGVFASGYSGRLAQNKLEAGWTFLLRPNVAF